MGSRSPVPSWDAIRALRALALVVPSECVSSRSGVKYLAANPRYMHGQSHENVLRVRSSSSTTIIRQRNKNGAHNLRGLSNVKVSRAQFRNQSTTALQETPLATDFLRSTSDAELSNLLISNEKSRSYSRGPARGGRNSARSHLSASTGSTVLVNSIETIEGNANTTWGQDEGGSASQLFKQKSIHKDDGYTRKKAPLPNKVSQTAVGAKALSEIAQIQSDLHSTCSNTFVNGTNAKVERSKTSARVGGLQQQQHKYTPNQSFTPDQAEAILRKSVKSQNLIRSEFRTPLPSLAIRSLRSLTYHPQLPLVINGALRQKLLRNKEGMKLFRSVLTYLLLAVDMLGLEKGMAFCQSTLQAYITTEKREDSLLAFDLSRALAEVFPSSSWHACIHELVRERLASGSVSRESLIFLYPLSTTQENPDHSLTYVRVQRYLEHFCSRYQSSTSQIEETTKLIERTIAFGIAPSEVLMIPLIRSLCHKGEVESAEDILTRMSTTYGFSITSVSLAEVVRGLARSKSWSRIDKMLSKLHEEGISRSKPYGFVAMVIRALEEYLHKKSPEQVYDFLTYYMESFGLVPSSQISLIALDHFIRAKRYDLVQNWVRERRERFPALSPATSTTFAALTIGNTWHRLGSSTEEILQACTAMAYGFVRDPFSKAFRGVAADAVLEDIEKRLAVILGRSVDLHRANDNTTPENSERLLTTVTKLLDNNLDRQKTTKAHLMRNEIVRKVRAANKLNDLFQGSWMIENSVADSQWANEASFSAKAHVHNLGDIKENLPADLPAELTVEILPHITEIEHLVRMYYTQQDNQSELPNQNVLNYLATKLLRSQRERDALLMFDTFYKYHEFSGAKGYTPFDIDTFETWLTFLQRTKDTNKFREVLWAVLDSNEELKISTRFLVLVRTAATKLHGTRFRQVNKAQNDEMEYLKSRLYRRAWEERGRPKEPVFRFGDWKA